MAQRYSSTAVPTTLGADMSNTDASCVIVDGTGWPIATFAATIERGTPKEEVILVGARAGSNCTTITRGYGGTAAVAHALGAPIEHTADAPSFQRFEDHLTLPANAHAASAISFAPTGSIAATNVQAAIAEAGTDASSAVTAHEADTTAVHGIADTAALATTAQITAHEIDTTNIHGVADTAVLLTQSNVDNATIEYVGGLRVKQIGQAQIAAGASLVLQSTSAPSSPDEGDVWYDTVNDRLMVWHGTQWRPPWNQPWGLLGYAQITADSTGYISLTDVPGMAVTATVIGNRRIRVTAQSMTQGTAGSQETYTVQIIEGTSNQLAQFNEFLNGNGWWGSFHLDRIYTPAAGTYTWKVRASSDNGVKLVAAAAYPAYVMVEDLGPNGVPV